MGIVINIPQARRLPRDFKSAPSLTEQESGMRKNKNGIWEMRETPSQGWLKKARKLEHLLA